MLRLVSRRRFATMIFGSSEEALYDVKNGSSIMIGGFGLCGVPENLLRALQKKNLKDLHVITNTSGTDDFGPGLLIKEKQVAKIQVSYLGGNLELERQYLNGEVELDLVPQGSLAERMRAGGVGISAFYTHTGAGSLVEEGGFPNILGKDGQTVVKAAPPREVRVWGGKKYLLETALNADFGLVKAWKADTNGNLVYRRTSQNFNPDLAAASKITIAEVEEIVPAGTLDPDHIHTPGIYVKRLVKGEYFEKPIERLTFFKGDKIEIPGTPEQVAKRERIARRASKEIKDGMYVNLGIGMPTLIPNFLNPDIKITLHSENGLLGIGRYPNQGEEDPDVINAGKETITTAIGASIFSSSLSFAIVRGNHLDLTILGGLQVSQDGDLANWIVPGKMVKGMGGAMDLVDSMSKCIVIMEHSAKGGSKVLRHCTLPLTGKKVVRMLITELGVFEFRRDTGMTLIEIAEGITLDQLKAATPAEYHVSSDLKTMQQ
jgi:3-oxoacid CoA-transferase